MRHPHSRPVSRPPNARSHVKIHPLLPVLWASMCHAEVVSLAADGGYGRSQRDGGLGCVKPCGQVASLVVGGRSDSDEEEPPVQANRQWHRSHIPTKGEEMCGGFCSSPVTTGDSRKPRLVRWGAGSSTFANEREQVYLHHISSTENSIKK